MYVVFVEELEHDQEPLHIARTLEQAFAQIVCRCGYSYKFEPADEQGWCLFLIDVERPERSPDPIHSSCIKPRDAQHDLMSQAVDGRLRGHVALHIAAYQRARVMRTALGSRVHVAAEARCGGAADTLITASSSQRHRTLRPEVRQLGGPHYQLSDMTDGLPGWVA